MSARRRANPQCTRAQAKGKAQHASGESETTAAKAQGYADGVGDTVMGKAKVCLHVHRHFI